MRDKVFAYIPAGLISLLLLICPAHAARNSESEIEDRIYHVLNLARIDPVKAADMLGLDAEELFQGIPKDSPFWDGYKWSLYQDGGLARAASAHARDMLDQNYFSSVSPEGLGPVERAEHAGYNPLAIYEDMALITFQNFISPKQAALEILRQYFIDEVEKFKQGENTIFSSNIKDVGLVLHSGKIALGGRNLNVYVFVIIYGVDRDHQMEESLIQIINSFRHDPQGTLTRAGLAESGEAGMDMDFLLDPSSRMLPPLVFYSSTSDLKWREQEALMLPAPFLTMHQFCFQELLSADATPWEVAWNLFARLINQDGGRAVHIIQHPRMNAAAIEIDRIPLDGAVLFEVSYTQAVFSDQATMLMGNVFLDEDGAGEFSPDLGLEDLRLVTIDAFGVPVSTAYSGLAGYFRLRQQPGEWNILEVWQEDDLLTSYTYLPWSRSVWLDVPLQNLPGLEEDQADSDLEAP